MSESFVDYAGDQTQPTAEIMNALSMNSPVKPEPQDPQVPVPEPPSEYDTLTVQLLQSPHQPDTWRRLVNVAEATGDISKISAAYDALLKQYPNTVCGDLVLSCFFFSFVVLS
jgi:cleavage stimulation factor subunit 3